MLYPEKNNNVTLGALVPRIHTYHPLVSGGSSKPAALQHPDQYLDHSLPMTTGHFWQMSHFWHRTVSICGEFPPRGPEVLIWPLLAAPNLPPHPTHCTWHASMWLESKCGWILCPHTQAVLNRMGQCMEGDAQRQSLVQILGLVLLRSGLCVCLLALLCLFTLWFCFGTSDVGARGNHNPHSVSSPPNLHMISLLFISSPYFHT